MSKQEPSSTLQMAQKLVNHLPDHMEQKLKRLLQRAQVEEDPLAEIEIIDLLSSHENIRRWMREQLSLQSGLKGAGYEPPAGNPFVPASEKWVCCEAGCTESLPVIQEDEDAPVCSIHGRVMERAKQ